MNQVCEICGAPAEFSLVLKTMLSWGLADSGRKMYSCDDVDHYVKVKEMASKGMGQASPVKGKR